MSYKIKQKYNKKINYVILICIIIVFIVISAIQISSKKNLIGDEVYSYGLANHQGNSVMDFVDGVQYQKGETPYEDYIMVQENEKFSYSNVKANQEMDVHPPLYYYILHTICSIFSNTFSIWYAGSINIFFSILTIITLYLLVKQIDNQTGMPLIVCAMFATSFGIQQANTFFRMYIMAMFFCTFLMYVHLLGLKSKELQGKFYATLAIVSILGGLTHYYFFAFLIFVAFAMICWLIGQKRFKELFCYISTYAVSGILYIISFPGIFRHLFGTKRGEETLTNFWSTEGYIERLNRMWNFINSEILGGLFGLFILTVILIRLLSLWKNFYRNPNKIAIVFLAILLFSCGSYFLVISKIAVYREQRYIHPIYALVLLGAILIIVHGVQMVSLNICSIIFISVCVLITIHGYTINQNKFLYENENNVSAIEAAEKYSDQNSVFVYEPGWIWACNDSYYEMKNYESITFIASDNLSLLKITDCFKGESLVVYIMTECNQKEILDKIKEYYPKYSQVNEISQYGYTKGYYLDFK